MRAPAAPLLGAALCALVAACASSTASPGGVPTDGSAGRDGGGGGDAGVTCQVNILPVLPISFDTVVAAPGARLRVQGDLTGPPPSSVSWTWSATFADGTPVAVTQVGAAPSLVELPIDRPGSYTIAVEVGGLGRCAGRRNVVAANPKGNLASYRFRFTPPPSGDPTQDRDMQVIGGTPTGGNVIVLDQGMVVPFDTRDATTGQPTAAYLRLTDPAGSLVVEGRTTAAGPPVKLRLPSGTFDVLVVPDGDLAPLLLPGKRPADLAGAGPLMLGKGEPVAGRVLNGAGPVAGANVVLRAGTLPSTLVTTKGDGAFTLHAAAGTYAATVTWPLPGSSPSTLEAVLPPAPGLGVPSGGVAGLDIQIGSYETASLNLLVNVGTRVMFESSSSLDGLVGFTAGGQTSQAAARVRGEVVPIGDGTVTVPGLPAASYRVTVVPDPSGSDAITGLDVALAAGNNPRRTVAMSPKVSLSGNLLPSADAAGILLTAVDVTGDLPLAISGMTAAQGMFALAVSPARSYMLRVRPSPDQPLAPTVVAPFVVGAGGLALANQKVPLALLYAGEVRDHSAQNGSPATLVQVFCLASAASCADPDTPVAETVTASDGSFSLRLPDPGVTP
jgi:hypothetical protein